MLSSSNPTFPTAVEEDIDQAVDVAIGILGQQGRMVEGEIFTIYNARVHSPSLGIIWYGDIDPHPRFDGRKLEALSRALGKPLCVTGEDSEAPSIELDATGQTIRTKYKFE